MTSQQESFERLVALASFAGGPLVLLGDVWSLRLRPSYPSPRILYECNCGTGASQSISMFARRGDGDFVSSNGSDLVTTCYR
jgi:hypothetical protein